MDNQKTMLENAKKHEDRITIEIEANRVLNYMNVGISIHKLDSALTLVWGNSTFYQQLGYTEAEFISKFQSLQAYFEQTPVEFEYLKNHFLQTCLTDMSYAKCVLKIPVQNMEHTKWFKITGTIPSSQEESKLVYIIYNDVDDLVQDQINLSAKQEETLDSLEWVISEYVGNVYISDMDTYDLLYVNKTSCETLNSLKNQLLGRKCYEAIQGRDAPCPFCTNSKLRKDKAYEWEFYNPLLKRTFKIKNRMLDWKGHKARIELSYDMYSEAYKLAKKDQEREAILNTIPGGMTRLDARDLSTVLWHNENFLTMIGYTEEQFEKELHCQCTYIHPEDLDRVFDYAENLKKVGGSVVFEARMIRRDGVERLLTVTLCYVNEKDSWDGIPSFYSIGLDTTEEKKQLKKLQHRAEKDALTGIYNRAETEAQIKQYLLDHPVENAALIMIDTDNFKQINDKYGHMVGDVVLTAMASCMNKIMRENDIVGRIGGDEFTILMKNITSTKNAEEKVQGLLDSIRHLFEKEKNSITLTCSVGIAMHPDNGKTFEDLYAAADKALYQAKIQGKNNYVVYNDEASNELDEINYSTLGARIDSEERKMDETDNLARHIFRILYGMDDFDKAINIILGMIGKQFDVSRVYIFESSEDGKFGSNTYEWCNDGIQPQIDLLQNTDYQKLGDYQQLFDEDCIFYCRDIYDLKPELMTFFSVQDIHSTLQCAYKEGDILSGFIGFDECTGSRLWTQIEVDILSLISQIISTFLRQKKAKLLDQKNRQYKEIIDQLEACVYISDQAGNILYRNKKCMDLHSESIEKEETFIEAFVADDIQFQEFKIVWNEKEAFLHIGRLPE